MKKLNEQEVCPGSDDLILFPEIVHVPLQEARQVNHFAFTLCTAGSASVIVNDETLSFRSGDLLIASPAHVVGGGTASPDFKAYGIGLSVDYARRILPHVRRVWDIKFLTEKMPIISLSPEDAACFRLYFELLLHKVPPRGTQREVADILMMAFLYDFEHLSERFARPGVLPYSSAENLFRRFIERLSFCQPKERLVKNYADALCVTPKYLSSVCKQISGQTASALIDSYVVRDIEYSLKYTRRSIKEISVELGFPNISFFGKYVRKHLGSSPKELRERFARGAAR